LPQGEAINVARWRELFAQIQKRLFGKDHEFVAIVVFLCDHRPLPNSELQSAAQRAWPSTVAKPGETQFYATGDGPIRIVKASGHVFNVLIGAKRYGHEPEEFAKSIEDLRIRRIILEHKAWFSVDYMGGPTGISSGKKYLACAKLAAELIPANCMGIYLPDKELILPFSEKLVGTLRNLKSVRNFQDLAELPVLEFTDEEAAAAASTAREKWPEFLRAFDEKSGDDQFFVKKRFVEAENVEFMWVRVAEIESDRIFGTLDSSPAAVSKLKTGDPLRLQANEIEDWLYIRNGRNYGGFLRLK
jgi:uncharacterized protein YegJ (DUF2314 family)